jgi:hypothetical protein
MSHTTEIVIVGFPKCGTTALYERLAKDHDVQALTKPGESKELAWPRIRDMKVVVAPEKLLVHKFTAYIFNPEALHFLARRNPQALFVLCIRNPARSLVSWHNMHAQIARGELRSENHFAWNEREFYASCSLGAYYEHFAKKRLQYDAWLNTALELLPAGRLAVVSQERMAQDIASVTGYLKALARGEAIAAPAASSAVSPHEGYADRAPALDGEGGAIMRELHGVGQRLAVLVADRVAHRCI